MIRAGARRTWAGGAARVGSSLAAALVLALACTPAAAQTDPRPKTAGKSIRIKPELLIAPENAPEHEALTFSDDVSNRDQLREMAIQWHSSVEEGNTAEASDVIPQMQSLLAEEGWKDRNTLLGSFVSMGKEWSLARDWERADRAYRAALALDPVHVPANLALGELAWERHGGVKGVLGLAGHVLLATKSAFGTTLGRLRILSNVSLVLLAAAALCACCFALVLVFKYNRLLRHGAQEALSERVPEGIDRILAWILVLLPLILWLEPAWWVIWWLVILRPYGTPAERRLGVVMLVVVMLTPPLLHGVSKIATLQQDPVVRALAALEANDAPPTVTRGIEALTDEPSVQNEARFLLARLLGAADRPDDALKAYNALLTTDARNAKAVVNRANIHFRRGDRASAIADYKLATDMDPEFALAWRNGSIAQAQELHTDVGTEWLRTAQKLDSDAVDEWKERVGPETVVDSDPSRGEVLDLIGAVHAGFKRDLLRAALNPVSIGALLGLVVMVVRARKGTSVLEAAACEKCGRAFCSRCHATGKSSAYCTQCVHLYVKKDGVSPVVRTAKLREVERWVAINSLAVRFFNILLPGAGSLYGNRVVSGAILLFLWSTALVALSMQYRLLADPFRLGYADTAVAFALELALLVACYLVALVQSLRHSG